MNCFARLLLIVIIFSAAVPLIYAAEPVIVHDSLASEPLGRRYEYLEDAQKEYTIRGLTDRVSRGNYRWHAAEQDSLNRGYTRSAYWLRFSLQNRSGEDLETDLQVEYPLLNRIILYVPGEDGFFNETSVGNTIAFSQRPVKHRTFIFRVIVPAKSVIDCYLRAETGGTMSVPVSISSPAAMQEKIITETMLLFMFYGIMLIMALYNLLIFIASRDLSYGYYFMYIVLFGLISMTLNGHADQFLWPESPGIDMKLNPMFQCLIVVSTVQFGRNFINTRRHAPRGDRVALGFVFVALAASVILPFITYSIAVRIAVFLAGTAILYFFLLFAVIFIRKRVRQAGYFLGAFILFFLGTLLYLAKSLGIIEESLVAGYGMQMGAAAQVTLLSLGLADRLNYMGKKLAATNTSLASSEKVSKERAEFLEKAVVAIRETAKDLISVSTELTALSDSFSEMSNDQATASEEMSATFEELSSSLEMIKNSTQDQKTEVEKTVVLMKTLSEAQDGVSRGNQSVTESIANISRSTATTEANLQEMISMMGIINDGGNSIGKFISLIDDISDKINLLSLNAAIEAARAGEYGRGFAVVADEIGKLAGATSDNSKEIAKVISKITADIENGMKIVNATKTSTDAVLTLVNGINSQIENVRSLVVNLKTALVDVLQQSTHIDGLSKNIADSTVEQASSMRSTMSMVETLSVNAQKLQSSNVKILTLSETLHKKIDSLKDLVTGIV